MDDQTPAFTSQHMEALVAFNVQLASQALPQLYADGQRELALLWALDERLDPFTSVTLRMPFVTPLSESFPVLRLFTSNHSSFCSFFSIALSALDQYAIKLMVEHPGLKPRLFDERLGDLVRACARSMKDHPDFSEFLFECLPEVFEIKDRSRSYDNPLEELAAAACRAGRLGWLAKIQRIKIAFNQGSLDGWALGKTHFFSTLDVEGCSALLGTGCLSSDRYSDLARLFAASPVPEKRTFALRLLGLDFDRVVQKDPRVAPGHLRFNCVSSSLALWGSEPDQTPAWWLGFYLDKGLAPFEPGIDGTRSAALSLLASTRDSDGRSVEVRRATTNERDDRCAELLLAMILARPDAGLMQDHFELGVLNAPLRERFKGARKIDLLALCIGLGYYRCADTLVTHGFDPKFASQQCTKWLKFTGSHAYPEDKNSALAYCEALLLGKTSIRASTRRDVRMNAQGSPPPVAAPTRRL